MRRAQAENAAVAGRHAHRACAVPLIADADAHGVTVLHRLARACFLARMDDISYVLQSAALAHRSAERTACVAAKREVHGAVRNGHLPRKAAQPPPASAKQGAVLKRERFVFMLQRCLG